MNYSPEELADVVAQAHRDGWQLGVHANGDAAIDVTVDAAWQCRSDGVTGSIEVGNYADLVLLEGDPTTVDPTAIGGTVVSETRLAGKIQISP